MGIYVDDALTSISAPVLRDAIEQALEQMDDPSRVVVEVRVGDDLVPADQLDDHLDTRLGGVDVFLTTATTAGVARDALEQARAALAEAHRLQSEAADLLQQDDPQAGFQRIGHAVELWLQVQSAVAQVAGLVGVDLGSLDLDGATGGDALADLVTRLQELKQAIASGDALGLADALAYEWPDAVAAWDRLIARLIDRVPPS